MQVTVSLHDGEDDEEGERIDASRTTKGHDFRLYSVDPGLLIRVTLKNLSPTRDISVKPVYVKENGEEEAILSNLKPRQQNHLEKRICPD